MRSFGPAAILRSLLLFNLIFAVQTGLDLTYLWGGVALPDGMSYATYAHRGAYPLIATALLAAVFVLAAMRPGSESERTPLIRALVFLWVAQNVLLVVSSVLRLGLYVEVYSLTYLRVAAFIWMGLVASGLVLIVARIALRRSNAWLIAMNLGSLTLTLYVSAFVNFAGLIASYNVAHSLEMSGQGESLDHHYLVGLGPAALPAIAHFVERRQGDRTLALRELAEQMRYLVKRHRKRSTDWRNWTFRGWRLTRYLERGGDAKLRRLDRLLNPEAR